MQLSYLARVTKLVNCRSSFWGKSSWTAPGFAGESGFSRFCSSLMLIASRMYSSGLQSMIHFKVAMSNERAASVNAFVAITFTVAGFVRNSEVDGDNCEQRRSDVLQHLLRERVPVFKLVGSMRNQSWGNGLSKLVTRVH